MGKQGNHLRTLVVHLGALGDFILALPAIAALARSRDVEAWGPSRERLALALAPRGPLAVARVLPDSLFGDEPPALDRFERVVVFAREEGPLAANLPGAVFVDPGSSGHVSDALLDRLIAAAVVPEDSSRIPTLDVARKDTGVLVVQPGAGGRTKRWAPERFAEVARRSGLETVCLLGPAELDPPQPALGFGSRVVEAPSLDEVVGLLASARAYLGNDAGVTHLAAAVGVPTVAVFGPTDPARWGPRGRGPVRIVQAPGGDLMGLGVEPVLEALQSLTENENENENENECSV